MDIAESLEEVWRVIGRLRHPCNRKAMLIRFLHTANHCEESTVRHMGGEKGKSLSVTATVLNLT